MKKTPLCTAHEQLGARMVDFSGWYMPVQYEGILLEHHATRQAVTLFDTCHMGRFLVEGPEALDGLSKLITCDLRTLPLGRCRYGLLLNPQAGILDDLITYRLAENRYLVVVNAGTREKDFAWFQQHLPAKASLTNLSESMSKLDLQGPASVALLSKLSGTDLSKLRYFCWTTISLLGRETLVSRTGYTGETGFELYVDTAVIVELWNTLLKAGAKPAGLGARDTLRLEAGLPLYGHEMNEDLTPAEAGFMRYAGKQEDFIGRAALLQRMADGPAQRLIGFRINSRQSARHQNKILVNQKPVGWVTSGSFSPTLGYSIGFAYMDSSLAETTTSFVLDTGRSTLAAELTTVPFYRKPSN